MSGLLVDAGPLYALHDRDDAFHAASDALLSRHPGPLVVPTLVITETAYLLGKALGARAEVSFAQDLSDGLYQVEPVHPSDWLRIAELVAQYRDFPLGIVDASVIAAAERLGHRTVATIDRRHFSAVRPLHVEAFDIVPT